MQRCRSSYMTVGLVTIVWACVCGVPTASVIIAAETGSGIQVLRGARVVTIGADGELAVLPRGSVVIRDGKIDAVGDVLPVPEDARVVDLDGQWLLPGFIDSHYLAGRFHGDTDEYSGVITENFEPLVALDPWDPELPRYHRRGVTSLAVAPGDRNVVGGVVSVAKVLPGRYPLVMLQGDAVSKASLGAAVLNLRQSRYPTSFSGAVALLETWAKTRAVATAGATTSAVAVAAERILVHVETRTRLERVLKIFKLTPLVPVPVGLTALCGDGWNALSGCAAAILGPFDFTTPVHALRGPAELECRGVPVVFASDGLRNDPLTSAVLAMRHGLSRRGAIAALTDSAARLYGLDGRIGRIQPGHDADIVAWSGDPLTLTASVTGVWVGGERVLEAPPSESVPAVKRRRRKGPALGHAPAATVDSRPTGAMILLRASRVYPVVAEPIDGGEVLVCGDRIVAVGKKLAVPAGTRTIEIAGTIVPGFIDGGSTLGLRGRAAEEFRELTPAIRAADGLDLDARLLRRALLAGVTTIGVTPGDRNVIGGLGAVVDTSGRGLGESILRPDAFLAVSLTRASALGNRSLRSSSPLSYYHRIPTTRMGTVFLVRRSIFEALDLGFSGGEPPAGEASIAEGGSGRQDSMRRLLTVGGKKVLVDSLRGARPIRIRAEEKEEIAAALRIADEFDISIIIEGFVGGVDLIDEIASRKIPVLLFPGGQVDGGVSKTDRVRVHDLARRLSERGVRFGFFSDDPSEVPMLRERVALDLRFGLTEAAALEAMTSVAASILGVDELTGSLEAGKRADVVAFSGDPFAITSRVEWVMTRGAIQQTD